MLHRMMAARFENIIKSDDIRFDIHIRIGNRIANACLCREIDHNLRFIIGKNSFNQRPIGKIALDKRPAAVRLCLRKLPDLRQTILLDGNIVIVVHVVQTDDLNAINAFEQFRHQIRANKSGRSRDEDRLAFQ